MKLSTKISSSVDIDSYEKSFGLTPEEPKNKPEPEIWNTKRNGHTLAISPRTSRTEAIMQEVRGFMSKFMPSPKAPVSRADALRRIESKISPNNTKSLYESFGMTGPEWTRPIKKSSTVSSEPIPARESLFNRIGNKLAAAKESLAQKVEQSISSISHATRRRSALALGISAVLLSAGAIPSRKKVEASPTPPPAVTKIHSAPLPKEAVDAGDGVTKFMASESTAAAPNCPPGTKYWGPKAYPHAKPRTEGECEDWTRRDTVAFAQKKGAYEARYLAFKIKYPLQTPSELIPGKHVFKPNDIRTLSPVLTDFFGMTSRHTEFLIYVTLLRAGLDPDIWQPEKGDLIELEPDGTIKGQQGGKEFSFPQLINGATEAYGVHARLQTPSRDMTVKPGKQEVVKGEKPATKKGKVVTKPGIEYDAAKVGPPEPFGPPTEEERAELEGWRESADRWGHPGSESGTTSIHERGIEELREDLAHYNKQREKILAKLSSTDRLIYVQYADVMVAPVELKAKLRALEKPTQGVPEANLVFWRYRKLGDPKQLVPGGISPGDFDELEKLIKYERQARLNFTDVLSFEERKELLELEVRIASTEEELHGLEMEESLQETDRVQRRVDEQATRGGDEIEAPGTL